MAFLNEINTYTNKHIVGGVVDNYFKNDPLLAYMKANRPVMFPGGASIQENFLYAPTKGGSYSPGASFDITRRQTTTGATFQPKFYYQNITEFKEDMQVTIKGPHAVFRQIENDMANAALTMSAVLAIDLYNEGQSAGRTDKLNGLDEALNDGTTNGWTGAAYANYGTLSRSGTGGSALQGNVVNVNGPVTFKLLEEKYSLGVIGPEEPDLCVTTNLGFAYIKQTFQPQQRFMEKDPVIGWRGLKFNSSIIQRSQYAPGTQGVNDADIGNYQDSNGETLWMLNTKHFRFWITDDPEFAFGFTGFKPAQDNNRVAGQILFSGNITCQAPRLQVALHTITG